MEFIKKNNMLKWLDGENFMYGFETTYGTVKVIGAYFNGASYTKDIGWKRDKRGACSKAFIDWADDFHNKIREGNW